MDIVLNKFLKDGMVWDSCYKGSSSGGPLFTPQQLYHRRLHRGAAPQRDSK